MLPGGVFEVGGRPQAPEAFVVATLAHGQPPGGGLDLHFDGLAEVVDAGNGNGGPELSQPIEGSAGAGNVPHAGSPDGAGEFEVGFGERALSPEGPWRDGQRGRLLPCLALEDETGGDGANFPTWIGLSPLAGVARPPRPSARTVAS